MIRGEPLYPWKVIMNGIEPFKFDFSKYLVRDSSFFFLIYNLNISYPLNNVFEIGISVYNHVPLK